MSFRLVLLTGPEANATDLAVLPSLFEAGLPVLHVRKPTWSGTQLEAYIQAIPARYHGRLVLHSHYELAARYALKGIHLTEHARQDPALRQQLRQLPGRSISASLHTLGAVAQHRRRYAYVFLSPIFPSISKTDYPAGFALTQVANLLHRLAARPGYRPQVVALGGVTPDNVGLVRQAGFAGAAVLGSIWQSPDPLGAWQQLQAAAGS